MKVGFVYIITNRNRTTLYIGVTNNIEQRILEHKAFINRSFASRFNLTDLVYYEEIQGFQNTIDREKQLKKWHRNWKWNLIKKENPLVLDLAKDWFTEQEIHDFKMENSD